MGNNFSYTVIEEQVVRLYDAGLLTLPILDILCASYSGTDIDSGGSQGLMSKDGKDMEQICVELINPNFKPNTPNEMDDWDEAIHWDYYDEFSDHICRQRWDWR